MKAILIVIGFIYLCISFSNLILGFVDPETFSGRWRRIEVLFPWGRLSKYFTSIFGWFFAPISKRNKTKNENHYL